jgi:periplasmic protein TonB
MNYRKIMKNQINCLKNVPPFDDIVFEVRNKEYGAYVLRRNYNRNVALSLLTAVILMIGMVIIPYLGARAMDKTKRSERFAENLVIAELDRPVEQVAPPPPPPPPPPEATLQQTKYVPPVVVDTLKPEEAMLFMTADEAEHLVQNTEVVDIQVMAAEEVLAEESEPEPFILVEEMPSFPGGDKALLSHIAKHLIYPVLAQENNMQGVVIVKFCVTAKGGVSMISILKGVDPELDKEAMRVVGTLPAFNPGKQGGKAVPVWFRVPIRFQLVI